MTAVKRNSLNGDGREEQWIRAPKGVVNVADITLKANTSQIFLTTENTESTEFSCLLGAVNHNRLFTTPPRIQVGKCGDFRLHYEIEGASAAEQRRRGDDLRFSVTTEGDHERRK